MAEGSGGGGGGASSSTLLSGGGRLRFEVPLKPGETTIVSWKKLMKDANKAANKTDDKDLSAPAPVPPPPVVANPALESRIAPPSGETAENEANDAPPGSRFSAVIEKIERLYMGKNSSDEEDLNDVPDDDEYDTEDSFIDDTELDEYFQVDDSAIKHDGFFVNRGKLERMNEPMALPSEQPKKRRRKDSAKDHGGSDDVHGPNKHTRVGKKAARKVLPSVEKNFISPSRSIAAPTLYCEDMKNQAPIIALETVVKKPSDPKTIVDPSPTRVLNSEAIVMTKNSDKHKTGVQSKKDGIKSKDGSSSPAPQKSNDKGSHVQSKSQSVGLVNNSDELNRSVLPKEKNLIRDRADIKAPEITQQSPQKNPLITKREGSSVKPKSTNTMLEKAIRDLEKIVAESRPPSMEVSDADNSSQAVKRRMPPEVKQKLAKVARLAHAIHGKLTKELLNRLMSIVGHLIQLRSLKRNLKDMVNMGLSAKEEKDARLQQLKKEIDEMVKIRAPMMKSKAVEQQAGSSADDFQDTSNKEQALKIKFTLDDALEDKICDLYDLFVDGLDEDAGPQVRKLYAELVELWPKGFMDNHGIKRAICRAKDRRKALYRHKDHENLKKKKLLAPKTDTAAIEPDAVAALQRAPDKPATDSATPVRSITTTIAANTAAARVSNSSGGNISAADRPKQEKQKGSSNTPADAQVLVKKKAKRKPEAESGQAQIRQEKPPPTSAAMAQGEEKQKPPHAAAAPPPAPSSNQPM